MTTVGDLIRSAREKKRPKLSQAALGRMLGVSRQAISRWENNIDTPWHDKHQLLADILGLPLTAFSPHTAPTVNGTEPDNVPRRTVLVLEWSDLALIHKQDGPIRVPAARQRMGLDATDDPQFAPEDCFAVRIIDTSMEPEFCVGDRVVLNRRLEPQDGDTVLARLADGTHLLRYYKSRGRRAFDLIAENAENFETITVNPKSPGQVIGVMVMHERRGRSGARAARK